MKQTRTQDTSTNIQTGVAPADGAIALPVRPGRASGGKLWSKAGVLALVLGFPLGASLLTAGEQPQYRFTQIPVTGPSFAVGNWIWDGENYTFYTVPGAVNGAVANGVNNRDQITGSYLDSSGLPKGFVKDGQNFTTIAVPGAIYTLGNGINNQGVVVGTYLDANGHQGSFGRKENSSLWMRLYPAHSGPRGSVPMSTEISPGFIWMPAKCFVR